MYNKSIWLNDSKKDINKSVDKDFYVDILIIGGGITGLSCAYFLKEQDVALIERNYIGCGATSKSTGKINYLQELLINKNKRKEDLYLQSQIEACKLIKKIIKDNKINCDYEKNSSYIYARTQKDIKNIKKIEQILKRNKIPYNKTKNKFLINDIYSISVSNTSVFNPYKYLYSLKELLNNKITIFEKSNATNYKILNNKIVVDVNKHKITCNKLIIATGYPFKVNLGLLPFKSTIYKSYLSASKIENNKKLNAISYDNLESLRFYTENKRNYLISSFDYANIGNYDNIKSINNLISCLKNDYNNAPIFLWSNCDISSSDGIPLAGEIKKNIYIACGYSSWGMTNATISAKIISDIILNNKNKYQKLFNPNRISNIPKLIEDNLLNTKSFIFSKFNQLSNNGSVKIFKKNNLSYGIYFDGKNNHIVSNICPHMKCNLIFNEVDKTWECPCHSSIFDIDGNVVKGPANYSIKVEK